MSNFPGFQKYPMWIDVDGPGHPESPGRVLVNNEDEEREALATGIGPMSLNGDQDLAEPKDVDDMSREELIKTLITESITDEVSDDDLRSAIKGLREHGGKPKVFGGGDGDLDAPPAEDASGSERAPAADDLANGKKSTAKSPDPKPEPANGDKSDDKAKAGDKPATDGIAAAGDKNAKS